MAYTTSGTFPENLKTTSEAQNSMFVNFFEFLRSVPNGEAILSYVQNFVIFLL